MSYTVENFKTRADLEKAVADGLPVRCFQPDFKGPDLRVFTGNVTVEGPHMTDTPAEHTWTAEVELNNGIVVKVIEVEPPPAAHTKTAEKPVVHTPHTTHKTKEHPAKTPPKEETTAKTKTNREDDFFSR